MTDDQFDQFAIEHQKRPNMMVTGWARGIHDCHDGQALWRWAKKLEDMLATAQAVVAKLPTTADGAPVVPGMRLYFMDTSLEVAEMRYELPMPYDGAHYAMATAVPFSQACSTREAAEAARGEEERESDLE